MNSYRLFERLSRIAGNSVYDRSGQVNVRTALSGAREALLVRQDRGFMRSELHGRCKEYFYAEAKAKLILMMIKNIKMKHEKSHGKRIGL